MEHTIGEIVTLPDGRKTEVVEGKSCLDCAMYLPNSWDKRCLGDGKCVDFKRTDGKNIIYKEVKEE